MKTIFGYDWYKFQVLKLKILHLIMIKKKTKIIIGLEVLACPRTKCTMKFNKIYCEFCQYVIV